MSKIRWVINPVDEEIQAGGGKLRYPRCARIEDPGQPLQDILDDSGTPIGQRRAYYSHVSAVSDTESWAISLVYGLDMTGLDGDPQIVHLLESDYDDFDRELVLGQRVEDLGYSNARLNRIRTKMQNQGVDTSAYTRQTRIIEIVRDLGRVLNLNYDPLKEFLRR